MVSLFGKVCQDQLTKEVTKTNYISVMADGATDVGGIENETVYCRFLRNGRPVNCLMGHIAVEHATAEGEFKRDRVKTVMLRAFQLKIADKKT